MKEKKPEKQEKSEKQRMPKDAVSLEEVLEKDFDVIEGGEEAQEDMLEKTLSVSDMLPKKSFLEKIIVGILLGFVFLAPIFLLPLDGVFSGFGKNLLLSTAVISTVLLTLFLWIKNETLTLPKSPVFGALFFLAIVYTLSSVFSGSFSNSFFGSGGETGTSFELILAIFLCAVFAIFFRTKERIFYAFSAFFISAFFVFLFQILHLIFPALTAFPGMPATKTASLIGQWSDFGIFSGIVVLLSLVSIEKLPFTSKALRRVQYVFLAVALFFYALVFYSNSWAILGVGALFVSTLVFFRAKDASSTTSVSMTKKWLSSTSFIVAVISFFLIFAGSQFNGRLFEILRLSPTQDVRPSFSGTYQVFRGLSSENPSKVSKETLLGVGPNRFFIPWQKYRPKEVNYTPWWGVDFNEGVGTIPSTMVSSGILGIIGWVIFLLLFFFGGLRAIRKRFAQTETFMQYALVASFVSASYAWVAIFLNTAGTVPFVVAFVFTGLFFGALSASGMSQVREYQYSKNPKTGFVWVVALLLFIAGVLSVAFNAIERTRSFFAYRNAVFAGENGNFEKSETEFQKAIRLAPSDAYYRSYSILSSYRAQQLISRTDLSPDQLREQFGTLFRASIDNASKAVETDKGNYINWLTLGNAYSVLVPLDIKNVSDDAYAQAKIAYEQASIRNPFNPQIPYILARIALLKKQPDEAIRYAKKALGLKNDYADAFALISQIEEGRGRSDEALASMEAMSAFKFSDPTVLFQLGYLRYKNGHYEEAAAALEKALQAIPDYSNARYFLGLSYFEFGHVDDAIKEFKEIERLNPDRSDISKIINNLQNGYPPLSTVAPESPPSVLTASTTEADQATTHKKKR